MEFLTRDRVTFELTRLGIALHRKIDSRLVEVYWHALGRSLNDEQFAAACQVVTDEDDRFPSIARLRAAGKAHRPRERGEPSCIDAAGQDIGRVCDVLTDLDAGISPSSSDQFRGRKHIAPHIERLIYEDAALTAGEGLGEGPMTRAGRIAHKAEEVIARMQASADGAEAALQPRPDTQ